MWQVSAPKTPVRTNYLLTASSGWIDYFRVIGFKPYAAKGASPVSNASWVSLLRKLRNQLNIDGRVIEEEHSFRANNFQNFETTATRNKKCRKGTGVPPQLEMEEVFVR